MKSAVDTPDSSTIPRPIDDGATRHLVGARVGSVWLPGTDGRRVDLAALRGRTDRSASDPIGCLSQEAPVRHTRLGS